MPGIVSRLFIAFFLVLSDPNAPVYRRLIYRTNLFRGHVFIVSEFHRFTAYIASELLQLCEWYSYRMRFLCFKDERRATSLLIDGKHLPDLAFCVSGRPWT